MKTLRIPLTIFCVLALSALTTHAAQLATAKVLGIQGEVTKYAANGQQSPLKAGEILKQGDAISASALSSAKLVFSNGSEVTVEENTSINLAQLQQDAFNGGQSYEQLQADPSKSQTLLELNYGQLSGHVKKLNTGSNFEVQTPLGTAAVRGTQFVVGLRYNAERGEFLLTVENIDGLVDILSRYAGEFEYGNSNTADKGYNSEINDDKREPIPPRHTIVIRLHRSDRETFQKLLNAIQPFMPPGSDTPSPTPPIPSPEIMPDDDEDPGVIVVSPEGQA